MIFSRPNSTAAAQSATIAVLTKRGLEPESGIRKQPGRFHGGHTMLRPKSLSVKTGEPHGESGALQTGYAITFGSGRARDTKAA